MKNKTKSTIVEILNYRTTSIDNILIKNIRSETYQKWNTTKMLDEEKIPLKRAELSIQKFNDVGIPHHLSLLRNHKSNIKKCLALGDWVNFLQKLFFKLDVISVISRTKFKKKKSMPQGL